jgi:hypothetical protein
VVILATSGSNAKQQVGNSILSTIEFWITS